MKRLLALLIAAVAVPAAPAQAATVTLDGATLRYFATEGEANHPIFHHRAEDELVVYDAKIPGPGVVAGPGCTQDGPDTAICPRAGVTAAEFVLLDRGPASYVPDRVTLTAAVPIPVTVRADPGSQAGVHYIDLLPITASLDGLANDGPGGRGDNLGPGVDRITGGDGADTLTGNDGDNLLNGDNGADSLSAGAGDDEIVAASFNDVGADAVGLETRGMDTIACGAGDDRVFHDRGDTFSGCERTVLVTDAGYDYQGTARNDRIIADRGPATVHGGRGNDRIGAQRGIGPVRLLGEAGNDRVAGNREDDILSGGSGRDAIFGAEGADRISARDGSTDTISCGPGRDTVTADRRDVVRRDCERVSRR